MRCQWWRTVLLEWDSNLANSCSVVEKKKEFLNCTFFAIFHFFQLLSCQWLGKTYFSLVPPYPVSPLGSEQLTPKVT